MGIDNINWKDLNAGYNHSSNTDHFKNESKSNKKTKKTTTKKVEVKKQKRKKDS